MKKLILTSTIALCAFTFAKSQTNEDTKIVHAIIKNEGLDYNNRTCYNVVYGKEGTVTVYVFKQYTTRTYYLRNGYVYMITDMFPDGAKYDYNVESN